MILSITYSVKRFYILFIKNHVLVDLSDISMTIKTVDSNNVIHCRFVSPPKCPFRWFATTASFTQLASRSHTLRNQDLGRNALRPKTWCAAVSTTTTSRTTTINCNLRRWSPPEPEPSANSRRRPTLVQWWLEHCRPYQTYRGTHTVGFLERGSPVEQTMCQSLICHRPTVYWGIWSNASWSCFPTATKKSQVNTKRASRLAKSTGGRKGVNLQNAKK